MPTCAHLRCAGTCRYTTPACAPTVGKALAERIRDLRHAMTLTLREVATRTGMNVGTVGAIETGRATPTPDQVSALAAALWVPPSVLLGERHQYEAWLREPRRRANRESTIYLGRDGYWHGRVTMGRHPDGTVDRRHTCGRDEAAVRRRVEELHAQRDQQHPTHA